MDEKEKNVSPEQEKETEGTAPDAGKEQDKQVDINDEQLDKIASKRTERAERSAITDYFKQQGLTEEEALKAFESFKADRQAKSEAERNNLTDLQANYDALQKDFELYKELANKRLVRAEAMNQATLLGVNPERQNYVLRLADLSKVEIDEGGSVNTAQVKEAIEQVQKDLPELFRAPDADQNGFKLGSSGETDNDTLTSKLSTIFGND